MTAPDHTPEQFTSLLHARGHPYMNRGIRRVARRNRRRPHTRRRSRTCESAASPSSTVDLPLLVAPLPDATRQRLGRGASRRSASRNRTRPPSDEIRPPSKAALTFLRWTLGRWKGRRLSSVLAGVAFLLFGEEDASTTNSYPMATAYATSATPKSDPTRIIQARVVCRLEHTLCRYWHRYDEYMSYTGF